MDWESWGQAAQQWGGLIIKGAVDKEFYQDFENDKLRLQALGSLGYYDEGQRGVVPLPSQGQQFPGTLLLIGGAVLLIFLLKD